MSGYLLDTNVISELTKASPAVGVLDFLSEHDDLWLSSVVLHELEFGLELLPHGHRRDGLRRTLEEFTSEVRRPHPAAGASRGRVGGATEGSGAAGRSRAPRR